LREEEYVQSDFIRYLFNAIKNVPITHLLKKFEGKELDTIVVKVKNLRDEVLENVKYEKLKGSDSLNKRFVRSYVLRFLYVMIVELAKGNTVVIGDKEIGFSLNTTTKKRQGKDKIIEYKTLRVYVHISEKLFKKANLFYYSHLDIRFRKAFKEIRKNIIYFRYPSNFLE